MNPKPLTKLRDELAEELSNICFCAGPTCSACETNTIKIFTHGFDSSTAIHAEIIAPLIAAIRGTLGHFALFNDEEDESKWPKYVKKCELALESFRKLTE